MKIQEYQEREAQYEKTIQKLQGKLAIAQENDETQKEMSAEKIKSRDYELKAFS